MEMSGLTLSGETYRRAFADQPLPMISYGSDFPEACLREILRLCCSNVYVIVSKALALNTDSLQRLGKALGDKIAGTQIGVEPHTPIRQCVGMIASVRELGTVDCIVTLGGGSVTDSGKLVRFALANEAYEEEGIKSLWAAQSHDPAHRTPKDIKRPRLPLICIPTSLAGGEYGQIAGATETKTLAKRAFDTGVNPTLVILDPELCKATPQSLWLGSGVRAVDHCVETVCSLLSDSLADEHAMQGLSKLLPGLIRCKKEPSDIAARHLCQLGVVDAMFATSRGVPKGASHAIGHQLGPLGVGHGETSCILLPAVCKYNAAKKANEEKQKMVKEALLRDDTVQTMLEGHNLRCLELDGILDAFIRYLGMPRSLGDVNIGRESFDMLATNTLSDAWSKTNAVPITEKSQALEILEMCV